MEVRREKQESIKREKGKQNERIESRLKLL